MSRRRVAAVLLGGAGGLVFAATGFASRPSPHGMSVAFQPAAASFVSPSTGFVLGVEHCVIAEAQGPQPRCPVVVMSTVNGGVSWREVSAPKTELTAAQMIGLGGPHVSGIVFADARDCWLYGPGLWATHDGGRHWARIRLNDDVSEVVAADGWAFASVYELPNSGPLLRTPATRDDWQPVRALASTISYPPPLLAASGGAVWIGVQIAHPKPPIRPELWRSLDNGERWTELANPCGDGGPGAIAATSASGLVINCGVVVTSTNGGTDDQREGWPSGLSAVGVSLAAPLDQLNTIVLASPPERRITAAGSWIARSIDRGRTWTPTSYPDHGAGFSDLQFVSQTVGWAIHGNPGAPSDQLVRTTNAGATFNPVRF